MPSLQGSLPYTWASQHTSQLIAGLRPNRKHWWCTETGSTEVHLPHPLRGCSSTTVRGQRTINGNPFQQDRPAPQNPSILGSIPLPDIWTPPPCVAVRYPGTLSLYSFTSIISEKPYNSLAGPHLSFGKGFKRPTTHLYMRSSPTSPSTLSRLLSNSNPSNQNMSPRTADRTMPSVSSPLSPRSGPLDIPSQARRRPAMNTRQSSNAPGHLRMPSLPRFHPANFSQSSSQAATPATGPNSPHLPISPRSSNNRQYEVQRQVYLYQQQLLLNTNGQARGPNGAKPTSPRLAPLASPGAVTPLELEDADGYLTAGVNPADAAQHVEQLIRNEARRRGDYSHGRPTSVGGS